jgi:23S rRNA pseudouridine2605 synthase
MSAERLQKILAAGGLGSRRGTEQLIREGRVRLNGRVVTELGTKADPHVDKIEVDGKRVVREQPIYIALHKPRGFVTTMSDPEGRPTIRDLLKPHGIPARVFPVGRLDYNTSGLLLLTNDGEFSDGLLHPRRAVPKTYVVKAQGLMEAKDLDRWREGVQLEDGRTLPAEAFLLRHEQDKTWFQITIREGRNNQIRRMGDATGFRVMRLARVSFAGITSEDIKPGDLRPLTYEELVELKKDYGVPRKPNVGREGIKGWEPRPRAGVMARRSGGTANREQRKRPNIQTGDKRSKPATRGRKRGVPEDIFADQPDAKRGPRGATPRRTAAPAKKTTRRAR